MDETQQSQLPHAYHHLQQQQHQQQRPPPPQYSPPPAPSRLPKPKAVFPTGRPAAGPNILAQQQMDQIYNHRQQHQHQSAMAMPVAQQQQQGPDNSSYGQQGGFPPLSPAAPVSEDYHGANFNHWMQPQPHSPSSQLSADAPPSVPQSMSLDDPYQHPQPTEQPDAPDGSPNSVIAPLPVPVESGGGAFDPLVEPSPTASSSMVPSPGKMFSDSEDSPMKREPDDDDWLSAEGEGEGEGEGDVDVDGEEQRQQQRLPADRMDQCTTGGPRPGRGLGRGLLETYRPFREPSIPLDSSRAHNNDGSGPRACLVKVSGPDPTREWTAAMQAGEVLDVDGEEDWGSPGPRHRFPVAAAASDMRDNNDDPRPDADVDRDGGHGGDADGMSSVGGADVESSDRQTGGRGRGSGAGHTNTRTSIFPPSIPGSDDDYAPNDLPSRPFRGDEPLDQLPTKPKRKPIEPPGQEQQDSPPLAPHRRRDRSPERHPDDRHYQGDRRVDRPQRGGGARGERGGDWHEDGFRPGLSIDRSPFEPVDRPDHQHRPPPLLRHDSPDSSDERDRDHRIERRPDRPVYPDQRDRSSDRPGARGDSDDSDSSPVRPPSRRHREGSERGSLAPVETRDRRQDRRRLGEPGERSISLGDLLRDVCEGYERFCRQGWGLRDLQFWQKWAVKIAVKIEREEQRAPRHEAEQLRGNIDKFLLHLRHMRTSLHRRIQDLMQRQQPVEYGRLGRPLSPHELGDRHLVDYRSGREPRDVSRRRMARNRTTTERPPSPHSSDSSPPVSPLPAHRIPRRQEGRNPRMSRRQDDMHSEYAFGQRGRPHDHTIYGGGMAGSEREAPARGRGGRYHDDDRFIPPALGPFDERRRETDVRSERHFGRSGRSPERRSGPTASRGRYLDAERAESAREVPREGLMHDERRRSSRVSDYHDPGRNGDGSAAPTPQTVIGPRSPASSPPASQHSSRIPADLDQDKFTTGRGMEGYITRREGESSGEPYHELNAWGRSAADVPAGYGGQQERHGTEASLYRAGEDGQAGVAEVTGTDSRSYDRSTILRFRQPTDVPEELATMKTPKLTQKDKRDLARSKPWGDPKEWAARRGDISPDSSMSSPSYHWLVSLDVEETIRVPLPQLQGASEEDASQPSAPQNDGNKNQRQQDFREWEREMERDMARYPRLDEEAKTRANQ
ncbi:unnamed protein product [Vitrella brassicaformis CCMP3155]|uniref:Uncharacterized protein n=2 Tax=Vitrella brassicaformis TaxID=1169539 RepID=A0A0G4FJ27_VITBC|nr:unnamed protein product [Vitrella brassicaformis CCMP3155]|eukprot:CEM13780.1 unnamed protein product [Vitrella brassicaformis CCMP3155]